MKMKLTNNLKTGILFIGISLLLFSCEKDELIPLEISNEIIPQKISLSQAKKDNDFILVSEKFKLNAYLNENNHSKNNNNFTIDFSSFYKIKKENYVSYTFLLKRNIKDKNVIQNLVVEKKNDTISGYIIKYNNIFYKKNGTDLFLNAKTSRTYFKENIEELLEQNNIKFHKKGGWSCSWNTTYTPRTCSVHLTFNEGNSDCGNYGKSNWTSSSYRTCNYVSTENLLVAETELDFGSGGGGGGGSGSGETVPIIPCANGDSLEQDINGRCFDIVEEDDKIDDSQLKPCMKTILKDLKGLNKGVAEIIKKFAGNTPGFNWVAKDGNLTGGTGQTKVSYNRVNKTATSTFDSQAWPNASDMSWARTMLHESIHAYIVASFGVNYTQAQLTFADYFREYQNSRNPNLNDLQHAEIVRNYVNDIAVSLKNYGVVKGYNLSDQFYNDLSWGGLQSTNAFQSLPSSQQTRILNVSSVELTGKDTNNQTKTKKGTNAGC